MARETCSDSEREWFPQRTVCYPAMEAEAAQARYESLHEKRPYHDGTFKSWAKDRSAKHPYHFKAGVTISVASVDLNPHDHFLGDSCDECSPSGGNAPDDDEGG